MQRNKLKRDRYHGEGEWKYTSGTNHQMCYCNFSDKRGATQNKIEFLQQSTFFLGRLDLFIIL